jgi:phosphate acetyltransferase
MYECLIAEAKKVPPAKTIVVHPCEETALQGAVEAADTGMIDPIFVAPIAEIKKVTGDHHIDISKYEIVDVPHGDAAVSIDDLHQSAGRLGVVK